jgi:IS30 family transposase
MTAKQKKTITDEQWDRAADEFELGLKHMHEIAKELGVHPSTVSRQMKRRGCVKGKRSSQTVKELEAFYDRRAGRKALLEMSNRERAERRAAALTALMDDLMRTIVAADKAGSIALAGPKIEKVCKALGVKPQRR